MSILSTQDIQIHFLRERVEALEKKVFKNKRNPVTMGQKLLLLKDLELIEPIKGNFKNKELFYQFLSIIIDADPSLIKQYLNNRELLEIENNYSFVAEISKQLKLNAISEKAEKKLTQFEKKV